MDNSAKKGAESGALRKEDGSSKDGAARGFGVHPPRRGVARPQRCETPLEGRTMAQQEGYIEKPTEEASLGLLVRGAMVVHAASTHRERGSRDVREETADGGRERAFGSGYGQVTTGGGHCPVSL